MWSKIAIFNQENDNTEDLARFLKLLRSTNIILIQLLAII